MAIKDPFCIPIGWVHNRNKDIVMRKTVKSRQHMYCISLYMFSSELILKATVHDGKHGFGVFKVLLL